MAAHAEEYDGTGRVLEGEGSISKGYSWSSTHDRLLHPRSDCTKPQGGLLF